MTIAAQSGLSDAEINNMINQAEQFAEADKKRKEVIEAKNRAESVIHETEKAMSEFKDQLDNEEAEKIREQIKELRELTAKGDDVLTPEEVKEKYDAVQQASLKLFEIAYKKRAAQQGGETSEGDFKDVNNEKKSS